MQTGALTDHIDVAQAVLYAFWLFFALLILYLLRENKREGYPLVASDRTGVSGVVVQGFPAVPSPKGFPMPDGSQIFAPRPEHPSTGSRFAKSAKFQGAPIVPVGEPLTAGVGPGAWANRHDVLDVTFDDGGAKIVPLRVAPDFFLAWEDPDIRGFDVLAADNKIAGKVIEAWIDRSEVVLRYVEIQLPDDQRVLLPVNFMRIEQKQRRIICRYIKAEQFVLAPRTKHPDQITLLEEDKLCGFYAGGSFYAWPGREGPLL